MILFIHLYKLLKPFIDLFLLNGQDVDGLVELINVFLVIPVGLSFLIPLILGLDLNDLLVIQASPQRKGQLQGLDVHLFGLRGLLSSLKLLDEMSVLRGQLVILGYQLL